MHNTIDTRTVDQWQHFGNNQYNRGNKNKYLHSSFLFKNKMTTTNNEISIDVKYDRKREAVKKLVARMSNKANQYNTKYIRHKRAANVTEAAMLGLSALLTSTLFLSYYGDPNVIIVSVVLSTLSSVASAVLRSIDFRTKQHAAHTSSLQYRGTTRHYHTILLRNGLSSADLDNMLDSINTRLGLIEDVEEGLELMSSA